MMARWRAALLAMVTLLLVNALPLYGVFFLDWNSFLLIYLHCF